VDLTESIIPKSDQLNAEDLLSGPRTVTIAEVRRGSIEQPVEVHLQEFPGRPFKPSKTVRRIMVAAWGSEASAYTGHRLTIYRDPTVRFGGESVGGIRVSHMSHIDKPLTIALTVTRGRRAPYVVEPLPDAPQPQQPPQLTLEQAVARASQAKSKGELRHFYRVASGLGMDEHTAADLKALAETLPETEVHS
jgi:hypothetical protein